MGLHTFILQTMIFFFNSFFNSGNKIMFLTAVILAFQGDTLSLLV
jgi:hypothetical protein